MDSQLSSEEVLFEGEQLTLRLTAGQHAEIKSL